VLATRHRLRKATSVVASLGLLFGIAAPAVGASVITVNIVSSPVQVTRGEPVSYVITVSNDGSSTVNRGTLEADTPAGFTYRRAITTKGTCNAAPSIDPLCDLGQFSSGANALVVLIFDTAPDAALGTFDFVVTVHGGEGPNDQPNSSHTDTFTDTAATTVVAVSQDYTVHYIVPEGDSITTGGVFGVTSPLSATNQQGTFAQVPGTPFGVPAQVSEQALTSAYCPPAFAGECLGQVSQVSIGNGIVLDPYLIVQIRYDSTLVRSLNNNRFSVIHWFDPYPTAGYEEISDICSDATPDVSELPCRLPVERLPDRDWLVTVFMESNGVVIGRG
jgi:hypothetical protein